MRAVHQAATERDVQLMAATAKPLTKCTSCGGDITLVIVGRIGALNHSKPECKTWRRLVRTYEFDRISADWPRYPDGTRAGKCPHCAGELRWNPKTCKLSHSVETCRWFRRVTDGEEMVPGGDA